MIERGDHDEAAETTTEAYVRGPSLRPAVALVKQGLLSTSPSCVFSLLSLTDSE